MLWAPLSEEPEIVRDEARKRRVEQSDRVRRIMRDRHVAARLRRMREHVGKAQEQPVMELDHVAGPRPRREVGDAVETEAPEEHEAVVAGAAGEEVVAIAAEEAIVAGRGRDRVVAGLAVERVVAAVADLAEYSCGNRASARPFARPPDRA